MFSKKIVLSAGAVGLVFLITLGFSFYFLRKTTFLDAAASAALSVVAPVQNIFTTTTGFIDGVWQHYFYLMSASRENEALRERLAEAFGQIDACREAIVANARLREYIGLMDGSTYQMIAAEVIARDPSPWHHTLIINKGSNSGVAKGCPVILPDGVVGHVLTVSSEYARVLLLIDRNCAVDALVQRTRTRGVVEGTTEARCRLNYLPRQEDVRVGDIIVSSGLDGIFPKGLSIGYVSKIIRRNTGLFQEIEVDPFVDFDRIEEVLVITNMKSPDIEVK
jgi:rod shape-determining protein MreC